MAEQVLTVMATCGMYDFSGEWFFRVGLPAKSGVAGGLVAVSPSQFGIGLYSPRLDERGNSVRGVAASRAISERFSLHLMHQIARSGPAFVRVAADGPRAADRQPPSWRTRTSGSWRCRATSSSPRPSWRSWPCGPTSTTRSSRRGVVIDLDHVTSCQPVAVVLLDAIIDEAVRSGLGVVTVDRRGRTLLHAPAEFPTRAGAVAFLRGSGTDRAGGPPAGQAAGGPSRTS